VEASHGAGRWLRFFVSKKQGGGGSKEEALRFVEVNGETCARGFKMNPFEVNCVLGAEDFF